MLASWEVESLDQQQQPPAVPRILAYASYPAPLAAPHFPIYSPKHVHVDNSDKYRESLAAPVEFNVMTFGAVGDGTTDDSAAFLKAWTAACAADGGFVHAPVGFTFLVNPVTFAGPCSNANMAFQVSAPYQLDL
ncbi:unnamed protein product [Calypogeia fissa]